MGWARRPATGHPCRLGGVGWRERVAGSHRRAGCRLGLGAIPHCRILGGRIICDFANRVSANSTDQGRCGWGTDRRWDSNRQRLTLDLQILAPSAFEDIAYPPPSSTHDGDDNPLWRPAVIVALALGMLGTGVGVGFAIAKCDCGKGEGNADPGKNVQENHYDDVEAKPFSPGDGRLMRQMVVERGKANAVTKTTP